MLDVRPPTVRPGKCTHASDPMMYEYETGVSKMTIDDSYQVIAVVTSLWAATSW